MCMKGQGFKMLVYVLTLSLLHFYSSSLYAAVEVNEAKHSKIILPIKWEKLQPILNQRIHQRKPKMRLPRQEAEKFQNWLSEVERPTPHLLQLAAVLPKTTLELLRAIQSRNVSITEAEKMAKYLLYFTQRQHFQNVGAFDENTSHIIGREWAEIDYTGEGMTWQGQMNKYRRYGITDFKSEESLIKFLKVESTLPYFKKIYRPTQAMLKNAAHTT